MRMFWLVLPTPGSGTLKWGPVACTDETTIPNKSCLFLFDCIWSTAEMPIVVFNFLIEMKGLLHERIMRGRCRVKITRKSIRLLRVPMNEPIISRATSELRYIINHNHHHNYNNNNNNSNSHKQLYGAFRRLRNNLFFKLGLSRPWFLFSVFFSLAQCNVQMLGNVKEEVRVCTILWRVLLEITRRKTRMEW